MKPLHCCGPMLVEDRVYPYSNGTRCKVGTRWQFEQDCTLHIAKAHSKMAASSDVPTSLFQSLRHFENHALISDVTRTSFAAANACRFPSFQVCCSAAYFCSACGFRRMPGIVTEYLFLVLSRCPSCVGDAFLLARSTLGGALIFINYKR
jgi:hypothetical protein